MAYGVYFRRKVSKAYARVTEYFKPTRPIKFYVTTDSGERMGVRDLRCETIEEANAVELRYIAHGYETKIKEVK